MIDEQTRDAERQVVGSCLISADALEDVLSVISTADLYDPRHQRILEACESLSRAGSPVDAITVADHLGADVTRAGGAAYLHELIASVVTAASAGWHAENTIRAASLTRTVAAVGHRLVAHAAQPGSGDALDLVDAARAELDLLATGRAAGTTHEQDVYAAIDDLEAEGGVPTPWRDLTEALGGWRPGCLYIFGARPAVGKSVIGNGAALDMARRGRHAHIASVEMSKTELYHRLLANVGSVDTRDMTHRRLKPADWARIAEAASHIAALPLSVDDSGVQRVSDIRARARAIARTGTLGIIVVDYLQLMQGSARTESRQQEVSDISRSLKLLAKELHVPVVALSQLKRTPEGRADKMPGLSDLRESGSLEQDADAVVLLHRDPDLDPDFMSMLVAKNRHGPGDLMLRLRWEGAHSRVADHYPTAPRNYIESRH